GHRDQGGVARARDARVAERRDVAADVLVRGVVLDHDLAVRVVLGPHGLDGELQQIEPVARRQENREPHRAALRKTAVYALPAPSRRSSGAASGASARPAKRTARRAKRPGAKLASDQPQPKAFQP